MSCDTSTDNGHKICSIPYTGTYNQNEFLRNYLGGMCTGCDDSTCYDNTSYCLKYNDNLGKITRFRVNLKYGFSKSEVYIHKGPKDPITGGYIGGTEKKEINIQNNNIALPTNEELKEDVANLIIGLEVVLDDIYIGRVSGLYYTPVSKLSKKSEWKGYNEGSGKIDIYEYWRQDIHNDGQDYKGFRDSKGKKILLQGSSLDSAVCGVWYKMINYNNDPLKNIPTYKDDKGNLMFPNSPIIGLCIAFRRFFNKNFLTEYIYIERGEYKNISIPPNSDWIGSECKKGEFISQLEMYYTDFNRKQFELGLTIAGISIFTLSIYQFGVGFKGFGMYRSIDYNAGLYDWIDNTDKFRCCQLLSNKQYDDDTVEKYVCRENLDRKVTNDFPNSYPNNTCKSVLSGWCNSSYINDYGETKYNIEDELCEKTCGLRDLDCDKGIKDYCTSSDFISMTGPTKYDLSKYMKDKICGCMYPKDSNETLKNLPLSFSTVLNNQLLSKDGITFRDECVIPTCVQTNYKLLNMKQDKRLCSQKDGCIGNGFMIPSFSDKNTSISCKMFGNSDDCVTPLEPKITILPDPFNNSCKGLLKKEMNLPQLKPSECKLSTKWYPEDIYEGRCEMHTDEYGEEKLMLRRYRQVESPSIPNIEGDNPLCPPKCGDDNPNCNYPLKTPDEKEPIEEWIPCPNPDYNEEENIPKGPSKVKIGISIFIFSVIFALIISLVIKLIKK